MARTIHVKLTEAAEKHFNELMYSEEGINGSCTISEVINHLLETNAAYEKITEDHLLGWLIDNHKDHPEMIAMRHREFEKYKNHPNVLEYFPEYFKDM